MSWDVWGEVDTGGPEMARVTELFNYTHNCNGMLREVGIDWKRLHGKPLAEVVPVMSDGIAKLLADPKRFIAMNPDNGWGSYQTLVPLLQEIVLEFSKHPKATLYACL